MDLKPSGGKSAADERPDSVIDEKGCGGDTAEKARPMVDEPPTGESQSPLTKDADTSPAPRRTSVKQIEANRRNALHSTGPTTPEGKRASRLNALTHGLRAKKVMIPGEENPAELEAIIKRAL